MARGAESGPYPQTHRFRVRERRWPCEVRESRVSSITNLDRPAANLQSLPMAKLSVILEEGPQKPPATLGDVLYAKAKGAVPEQHWATLVEAVAAGNQLALHELYELAHRIVFTLIMRPHGKPGNC